MSRFSILLRFSAKCLCWLISVSILSSMWAIIALSSFISSCIVLILSSFTFLALKFMRTFFALLFLFFFLIVSSFISTSPRLFVMTTLPDFVALLWLAISKDLSNRSQESICFESELDILASTFNCEANALSLSSSLW